MRYGFVKRCNTKPKPHHGFRSRWESILQEINQHVQCTAQRYVFESIALDEFAHVSLFFSRTAQSESRVHSRGTRLCPLGGALDPSCFMPPANFEQSGGWLEVGLSMLPRSLVCCRGR